MLLHIFAHLLVFNALLLFVDFVLLANRHESRKDHSLHESGQDQGDYDMEGAEHHHNETVVLGSPGCVVEGNHRPPRLSKDLEHNELSIQEVIEV